MAGSGFQKILDSAAYHTDLEKVVAALLRQCGPTDSESTIASVFENELYHFIRVEFNVSIKFNKESGKNFFRHEFNGRIDAISNGFVIEYKKQRKLATDGDRGNATAQIQDYLQQLCDIGSVCSGVVTDGRRVCFFYWNNGKLRHTGFASISVSSVDRIVRFLIGSEEKAFTSRNILDDFTLSNTNNPTYSLAQEFYSALVSSPAPRTNMLYEEWLSLFHLSEMDSGKNKDVIARREVLGEFFRCDVSKNDLDYKALFALQTTYALVMKLIACKVIGKLAYDDSIQYFSDLSSVNSNDLLDFLSKLEDGYVYPSGGVHNLLEGDYFSWYAVKQQWRPTIAEPIKEIISQVEMYATLSDSRMAVADIFKDLYMDFIPAEVRHSLGEYYTPDWLVDHIVGEAIERCDNKQSWTGIDPCCGSGVFVLNMIDRIIGDRDIPSLSKNEKRGLLEEILSRVAGIDINPLSALTSRVNFFLAISDLIEPEDEIEIPIYVGDSAVMPNTIMLSGVPCYSYQIDTTKKCINAVLPVDFVKSSDFLTVMNGIQTYVKTDNATILYDELTSKIRGDLLNDEVCNAIHVLVNDLVDLHVNDWDGIWVRIVSNFMLVARVSDRDLIVGNPPWVKWEYLPEQYAQRLKGACLERNMFSGQSYMGAISLNICAAIAIMTASAWLREGGVLAFLMPTNLLTQDSYEGFRKFKLARRGKAERLYLQYVERWTKVNRLFGKPSSEPCASYYYKNEYVNYSSGFPVRDYEKNRGKSLDGATNWADVEQRFSISECVAAQVDQKRTGYTILKKDEIGYISKFRAIIGDCAYRGRTGVEFVPDEVTFLKPVGSAQSPREWRFRNIELKAALHKIGTHETVSLETLFVHPLLVAPEIRDFAVDDSGLCCLFPYRFGETECCPLDALVADAEKTGQYLVSHRDLFVQQSERSKRLTRGDEFYALSKVGPYTYQKNMVVIRDNTRMCGSVVSPKNLPWGGKMMPIPAKHAAIISTHSDAAETPITKDEAYYVAGIFNTPVIRKWYACTYSGRSYSIKFAFKLPLYDSTSEECKRIVGLSKRAHRMAALSKEVDGIERRIEASYLALCGYVEE